MPSSHRKKHHRKTSSTTVFLAIATLFSSASSHALPRATRTVAVREFAAVQSYPLQPTQPPSLPFKILRRDFNTVCGYLGGDDKLPATCSAGSHCVADEENSVIGCCPNEGPCTQGIFTACVDGNSDPQKEINPYVFTCTGSNVCYKNKFDGGFFQWGCGSTSALATTVQSKAEGAKESVDNKKVSVKLTAEPTSLDKPTTIGTRTRPKETKEVTEDKDDKKSGEKNVDDTTVTFDKDSKPALTAMAEDDSSEEPSSSDSITDTTITFKSRTTSVSSKGQSETTSESEPTPTDDDDKDDDDDNDDENGVAAKTNPGDDKDGDNSSDDSNANSDDDKATETGDAAEPKESKNEIKDEDQDKDENNDDNEDDDDDDDSAPVGAIVGGSVGGVAALALIFTLVGYFLRRRSRKRSKGYADGEYITSVKNNPSTREFRKYRGGLGGPGVGGAGGVADDNFAPDYHTYNNVGGGHNADLQGANSPLTDNRTPPPGAFRQLNTTMEEAEGPPSQPYGAARRGPMPMGLEREESSRSIPLAVAAGVGQSPHGTDYNQPFRNGSPTPVTPKSAWTGNGNPYSAANWDAGPGANTGGHGVGATYGARSSDEHDQEPLTASTVRAPPGNELDEFSRGYRDAVHDVSPEHSSENEDGPKVHSMNGKEVYGKRNTSDDSGYGENVATTAVGYSPRGRTGEGAFWQQKTRQSRNLMWM